MATKVGLEEARAVVDEMLKAATETNLRFAAAVVDSGGELVFMARMDGASAVNARMPVNKAYTASKWGQNTKALNERLFDISLGVDRCETAWFGDARFTAVWGGIVLRSADGTILGALGESGGSPEQDEEIDQVGARVFAAL